MSYYLENKEFQQQIKQLDHCSKQVLDSIYTSYYDILKNGIEDQNVEKILTESNQLNTNKELIRNLLLYMIQAIKFECSEDEIREQLTAINCNPYFQEKFIQSYKMYYQSLSSLLTVRSITNSYDQYVQLKWRFEVKLAGKYCREQFQPYVLLSFHTKNPRSNERKYINIQCSVADIYHIFQKIREAVESNNSFHCTKLLRNIKL